MKKKEILWILIFALLFGSPFVSWFFLKNSVDTQNYENREVTEMPKFPWKNMRNFRSSMRRILTIIFRGGIS